MGVFLKRRNEPFTENRFLLLPYMQLAIKIGGLTLNKVILMGRLTRDPEIRYSQSAEPLAIARYGLAVNRRFKRQGEPDADFIDCVVFGKPAEFCEKYFKKGMMICVSGRLSVRTWEDNNGQKRKSTEVVVDEQEFAESKASFENRSGSSSGSGKPAPSADPYGYGEPGGFTETDENIDDDLPF